MSGCRDAHQQQDEQPDAPSRPGSDTIGAFALSESGQPSEDHGVDRVLASTNSAVHSELVYFLPEEGLGHGPVVPFPAYGFAALVSNNNDLNSLNSVAVTMGRGKQSPKEGQASAG